MSQTGQTGTLFRLWLIYYNWLKDANRFGTSLKPETLVFQVWVCNFGLAGSIFQKLGALESWDPVLFISEGILIFHLGIKKLQA